MRPAVNAILTRFRSAIASVAFGRAVRAAMVVWMLPVLLFGPLVSGGVVIHDHHECDTHIHRLADNKPGGEKLGFEQDEEHHDHDRLPADPWDEETAQVLILHDLARITLSASSISSFARQIAPKIPVTVGLVAVGATGDRFVHARSVHAEGMVRADSATAAILLTNHALLL